MEGVSWITIMLAGAVAVTGTFARCYAKIIYSKSPEEGFDDFIFPEIQHEDEVRLEGKLTRGNEQSNTVGFEYQGHIELLLQYSQALLSCQRHDNGVYPRPKKISTTNQ